MDDNDEWESVPKDETAVLESNPEPEPEPEPKKVKVKKPSKIPLLINVFLALIAGAMIGFFAFWYTMGPRNNEATQSASIKASTTPAPTPQNATGSAQPATSENIVVNSPLRGSNVKSPIHLQGSARVFESAFAMRLKDVGGKIIAEQTIITDPGEVGQLNPYSVFIPYPRQTLGTTGTLEVYTKAASDGHEQDLIQIPVVFN